MKKMMKTLLVFAVLLGLTAGCASTSGDKQTKVPAGKESYFLGTFKATVQGTLPEIDRAIRSACDEARLLNLSRATRYNRCEYLYRDLNGVRLVIVARKQGENVVQIVLETAHGDKAGCRLLMDAIRNHLAGEAQL